MNRTEELVEAILKLNDTLALQPTDWSSWALVGITLVYVIATILICWFTCRSAKAMQEQTKELQRQFDETNRPNIDVTLHIAGDRACLKIENTGKKLAKNLRININDNFINFAKGLREGIPMENQTFHWDAASESLVKLNDSVFSIGVEQRWFVYMFPVLDFQKFGESNVPLLEIDISYEDNRQTYSEHATIDFTQYGWVMPYDSSLADINRHLQKISDTLEHYPCL